MESLLFRLSSNEVFKGVVTAVFGSIIVALYTALSHGGAVDFVAVGNGALVAGLGYLVRKFFTGQNGNLGTNK